MDFVGKIPIHPVLFWIGKASILICLVFGVVQLFGVDRSWFPLPALRPWAVVLLVLGACLMAGAVVRMGRRTRMGLPEGTVRLETGGIYRFSRNPMYLSIYLICLASCLYTPNPWNWLCAAAGIAIHHRIVFAEERFLEKQLGETWRAYRDKVRRYL